MIPMALGVFYLGTPYLEFFIGIISCVIIAEYTLIKERKIYSINVLFVFCLSSLVIAGTIVSFQVAVFILVLGILIIIILEWIKSNSNPFSLTFAFIYSVTPALLFLDLNSIFGLLTVYWLFIVVWSNDIGAYIVGQSLGGIKLAPKISPNKTWSGAFGGLCLSMISSMLFLQIAISNVSTLSIVFSFLISITSQIGDLLQSYFKRLNDVKNSSNWVPGHGGVMDRIDGLWVSILVTYFICLYQDGGVVSW